MNQQKATSSSVPLARQRERVPGSLFALSPIGRGQDKSLDHHYTCETLLSSKEEQIGEFLFCQWEG
jgi:hypothetical protein